MRFLPTLSCVIGLAALCAGLIAPPPAGSLPSAAPYAAERETQRLFQEEIQQCDAKLNWRGEPLADDTVYAAALTGLSWQAAWGRDHIFSLAWGDLRKIDPLRHRTKAQAESLIAAIQQRAARRDDAGAVKLASENFAVGEIGCRPELKAAVGGCLLRLGRPEAACDIFAAPFDPGRAANIEEKNRVFRQAAFEAAAQAAPKSERWRRVAIAFALSLALEPGAENAVPDSSALTYLENNGVDIERVLLGILEAPERLRGLPAYSYAAADLLTVRAAPRLLPFLMHLAQSDDVYLRGRAVIGLGILAYHPRPDDAPDWKRDTLFAPLHEYGLSLGERKMALREAKEAAASDKYRLRTAAAIALALMGDDANLPLLKALAKDRAYLLSPPEKNKNAPRRIFYPVRTAAAQGLYRFGVFKMVAGSQFLTGKALEQAKRGGQDVTNDRRNLRKVSYSELTISPLDSK